MKKLLLGLGLSLTILSCKKEFVKPYDGGSYKMVLTGNDVNTKYEVFHIRPNKNNTWLNVGEAFTKEWTQTTTELQDLRVVPMTTDSLTRIHLYIYKNNAIVRHGYAEGVNAVIHINDIF